MMRPLLLLYSSLLLFFVSCKAQPKQVPLPINDNNNSLLWEISGKGLKKNSYLFGTFHLMCKNDIHLSDQLKNALSNADTVYMELDMDDPSVMLGGLMMMNMKGGKKLKDLYNEDDYKKLTVFFKDSLHMPVQLLETTKPYFLVAMLYPRMMPCKSVSGIEEELMKLVKAQQKQVKGLETIQFQAAVFDSIPYSEQAKELLKCIDSLSVYKKYFDTMMRVYKSQRLDEMEKLFSQGEFGMEEHQDILLDDRNKNWVSRLKTIMNRGSVLVAVGAGHLAGEKGLIALLKKGGYVARPVVNR